jgi:hypothetical protein
VICFNYPVVVAPLLAGKAEVSGFGGPKAALYVVSKAGYFPDVCEGLAHKHLAKGDKVRENHSGGTILRSLVKVLNT